MPFPDTLVNSPLPQTLYARSSLKNIRLGVGGWRLNEAPQERDGHPFAP